MCVSNSEKQASQLLENPSINKDIFLSCYHEEFEIEVVLQLIVHRALAPNMATNSHKIEIELRQFQGHMWRPYGGVTTK